MPQSHINRSVDIFIFIQRHTDHQHCTASELKNTYPNKNISIRISMQPEDMAIVVETLW